MKPSARWGSPPLAKHKTKNITLYHQGDITYMLNAEPESHAVAFIEADGPCPPAMAWRVVGAQVALQRAHELGATEQTGLDSRALTPPDSKIRIPINESTDDKGQAEEN